MQFSEIKEYKDSDEKTKICNLKIKEEKYQKAIKAYESEVYQEALVQFSEIKEYKDSGEKIKICNLKIKEEKEKEEKYQKAIKAYESELYQEALVQFDEIKEYKDSTEKIKSCEEKIEEKKRLRKVMKFITVVVVSLAGYFGVKLIKTHLDIFMIIGKILMTMVGGCLCAAVMTLFVGVIFGDEKLEKISTGLLLLGGGMIIVFTVCSYFKIWVQMGIALLIILGCIVGYAIKSR